MEKSLILREQLPHVHVLLNALSRRLLVTQRPKQQRIERECYLCESRACCAQLLNVRFTKCNARNTSYSQGTALAYIFRFRIIANPHYFV